jgi:hypothetical protein
MESALRRLKNLFTDLAEEDLQRALHQSTGRHLLALSPTERAQSARVFWEATSPVDWERLAESVEALAEAAPPTYADWVARLRNDSLRLRERPDPSADGGYR